MKTHKDGLKHPDNKHVRARTHTHNYTTTQLHTTTHNYARTHTHTHTHARARLAAEDRLTHGFNPHALNYALICSQMDEDGGGQISWDEFAEWYFKDNDEEKV